MCPFGFFGDSDKADMERRLDQLVEAGLKKKTAASQSAATAQPGKQGNSKPDSTRQGQKGAAVPKQAAASQTPTASVAPTSATPAPKARERETFKGNGASLAVEAGPASKDGHVFISVYVEGNFAGQLRADLCVPIVNVLRSAAGNELATYCRQIARK